MPPPMTAIFMHPPRALRAEFPYHLYDGLDVLDRGFRQNTVAEIEDVTGARSRATQQVVNFGAEFGKRARTTPPDPDCPESPNGRKYPSRPDRC